MVDKKDTSEDKKAETSRGDAPNGSEKKAASESTDEVAELNAELEKAKSDFLYLRAEFDNYRKQTLKERSHLIKYGAERLLVQLLEVLDNFDRALEVEVNSENLDGFVKGVQLIANDFHKILESFGVKAHNPEGQPFDPMSHEALGSEESSEVDPGHVLRVLKKAYQLHDRVIRPAQVVVATPPREEDETKESNGSMGN